MRSRHGARRTIKKTPMVSLDGGADDGVHGIRRVRRNSPEGPDGRARLCGGDPGRQGTRLRVELRDAVGAEALASALWSRRG